MGAGRGGAKSVGRTVWGMAVILCLGPAWSAPRAETAETSSRLILCCSPGNDLHRVLSDSGIAVERVESFEEAVAEAPEGAGVLLLADGYPSRRSRLTTPALEAARARGLRLYLEYPDMLPGRELGPVTTTTWERLVVCDGSLSAALPPMTILSASDCHYLPVKAPRPLVSLARVAGFDRAVNGLPDSARPVLFEEAEWNALVAVTGLSRFSTGRYGPAREWGELWRALLTRLSGGEIPPLRWTPPVRPRYGRDDSLTSGAERRALDALARWTFESGLLLTPERAARVRALLRTSAGEIPASDPDSRPEPPGGDGSHGILEGYASRIRHDGRQVPQIPLRADCQAETAMVLAMDAALQGPPRSAATARNLLDFTYGPEGFCTGARANPAHAAYGHIAWGIVAPAWEIGNYGDDNARTILATLAAGALLQTGRWNEPALRAVVANFRTTGRQGFRGDRIDMSAFEAKEWRSFFERDLVNASPHFESALWACYLWAYRQTGYEPFLSRTRTGVRTMMEAYPAGWRMDGNTERARMLLCLAWLIRVEDTPQHRDWTRRVARDLLQDMQPCGAIPERFGGTGGGHYLVPASNETFGTGESPLIQTNGDPVSDQLYTTGFALIALHEAAAATGEGFYREAENRLADYLCRIQVRSEEHPYLDGAWLRAFDFERWDYWASAGDIGWGPWCAEAGWGQAWIGLTFGLRERGTSLWELLGAVDVSGEWEPIRQQMLER